MDSFTQVIIYDTPSPANIYSATEMHMVDGTEKILMISSKKEIITLESEIENDEIKTSVVQLDFSKIPNNARIISIHCINKSKKFNDFVIGITYAIIAEDQNSENYLNIYFGYPGSSLEKIMNNCKTFELDFIPFQLNYCLYMYETHRKGMWLLSGSDTKIHAYKCEGDLIYESKLEKYFIEFENSNKSIILCFGSKLFSNYKKRISFYGCETGYIMLAIVDTEKNHVLIHLAELFQSPITVMQLFNIYNKEIAVHYNISTVISDDHMMDYNIINENTEICLLVGSTIECAVVYMDILKNNLGNVVTLINSNRQEVITTSLITDMNFDSKNEILLGTSGNCILNYAYENNEWVEQQQLDLRHPVYTISYLDITHEGVKDLIVMSEKGIHVLKHEPKDIVEIIKNRLHQ